jgi:hypothetical protein
MAAFNTTPLTSVIIFIIFTNFGDNRLKPGCGRLNPAVQRKVRRAHLACGPIVHDDEVVFAVELKRLPNEAWNKVRAATHFTPDEEAGMIRHDVGRHSGRYHRVLEPPPKPEVGQRPLWSTRCGSRRAPGRPCIPGHERCEDIGARGARSLAIALVLVGYIVEARVPREENERRGRDPDVAHRPTDAAVDRGAVVASLEVVVSHGFDVLKGAEVCRWLHWVEGKPRREHRVDVGPA